MSRDDEFLKNEGVFEMQKSQGGRQALDRLRKRHEIDLLQPSDPRFERVYGKEVRKNAEIKSNQERMAADEWREVEVRREEKEKRDKDPGYKKFF